MRNYATLIAMFFVFFVFTTNAQKFRKSPSAEFNSANSLAAEKVEEIQNKIARIESHIQAIETKRAFVLSSQEETQRATEIGWFDSMAEIQSRLLAKKTELVNYLNSLDNE
tara:strand:- start:2386 stop:2718 length:333 start_codon:yes stop_codon:yes gene_type:complete